MAKSNKKTIYLLLLIALPLANMLLGTVSYLWFIGDVREPNNPQDSSGWLLFLVPIVAGGTFAAGLLLGGIASLVVYFRDRLRTK